MLREQRYWAIQILSVLITVSLFACTITAEDADLRRTGAQGESCTRTSDCDDNLICIDRVCQLMGSYTPKTDAGEETPTYITRGQVGESCRARSDCDANLACIQNVCTTASGIASESPSLGEAGESCMSYADCRAELVCVNQVCSTSEILLSADASTAQVGTSNRGESCETRTDCKPGLACVSGTCELPDFDLTPNDKECVSIQCRETTDCCDIDDIDITAGSCYTYDSNCEMYSQPNMYCDQFTLNCTCEGYECVEGQCIREPSCEDSSLCTLFSSTKIFCSDDNKCVECIEDEDCNDDDSCEDNQCVGGCKTNLECPYFHECQSGSCVEVGCQNDRECIAFTGNVFTICEQGQCMQPCETDLECSSPDDFQFSICMEGYCRKLGCETNEECRLRMNLLNPNPANIIDVECR